MADDPEVNKLQFNDFPPHVLQAVYEEHRIFRKELLEFGPRVVTMDTLKPRLRAAAEQATRQHEQESRKYVRG